MRSVIALLVLGSALLSGCSGDSGAPNTTTTAALPTPSTAYSGPAPQTSEIQNFKSFFWDPLSGEGANEDKCGSCHDVDGTGPTKFVHSGDINLAFAAANTVVDLDTPENSLVVQRVSNGHNCWRADSNLCRSEMIGYIEGWRDGAAAAETVVALTAPNLQDPSGSKIFPSSSGAFETTVWPLLTTYCSQCHSDTAALATRQTPYFASADVDLAYDQVKSKIDLVTPSDSRLVLRLAEEFHNCWDDCVTNAATMQAEIGNFANPIPVVSVDPDLVTSKALRLLDDGIVAASGGRVENDVIALYEFKVGSGNIVIDRSGVLPSADLILSGDYDWLGAWGIQLRAGKAQATVNDSKKIHDLITATGEYSIEAWVAPANVTQEGPARIVSYSGGNTTRNLTLGQTLYNYDFMSRTSGTDANGEAGLSTADADEVLQATLQHVVVTYEPVEGRKVYVNGVLVTDPQDANAQAGSSINNWNDSYAFVLGNEVSGNQQWQGAIRLVAVHSRALSEQSVQTNFDANVGQKYFLLFSISHLVNTPQSYIVFEVSQYDNYSYLFAAPYYISLDENAVPTNFAIKAMRIGINGKIAGVGQAYATLDTQIDNALYDAINGYQISGQGSVIPLESGPQFDQFFLTFDQLDTNSFVLVEADPPDPVFAGTGDVNFDIAVRNFSEINQSFAQITGVSSTTASVSASYQKVIQQLPSKEDIQGFLSSHQMGVTQLAIAYCDVLIETKSIRDTLSINLDEVDDPNIDDANAKSVAVWDADFITPMLNATLNTGLTVQPNITDTRELIHHLLFTDADGIAEIDAITNPVPHGLSRCAGGCPDGKTASSAKAACTAVLGSAAVTLQ